MATGKKALTELHARIFKDERMIILAVVAVILFAIESLVDLPQLEKTAIAAVDWLIWAAFVADFSLKLYCAPSISYYLRNRTLDAVIDGLIVLSPVALLFTPFEQEAFLAPLLRIARFERLVRIVRVTAYIPLVFAGLDKLSASFYRHKFYHYLAFTFLSIGLCAALEYSYEKNAVQGLATYEDALWWSAATVATTAMPVFPVSVPGRMIGGYLILVGIGLLAILTANVAAYFVESHHAKPHKEELEIIDKKLDRLTRMMQERK